VDLLRTFARWALILFCLLGLPAFAVSTMTTNSTPTPRPFPGWAVVLTDGSPDASRLDLRLVAFDPGGYGRRPRVQYTVAACGAQPFRGALLLGGQARLDDLHVFGLPTPAPGGGPGESPHSTVALERNLPLQDLASGFRGRLGPVQIIRLELPAFRCRVPFARTPDEAAFLGSFVFVQGRLQGEPHRASFAPFGVVPVRQAQSWPLLGSLPSGDNSLGEFRFGSALPGSWSRPLRSYFRLDVGTLDAKANVDFSRPPVTSATGLAWTSTTPFAASARVTNADNLAKWQTLVLAVGAG
jgi:hypothetical protein